jgi:hypothetical protein
MFCRNIREYQSTLHLLKTPSLHFSLKTSVYKSDEVKWDRWDTINALNMIHYIMQLRRSIYLVCCIVIPACIILLFYCNHWIDLYRHAVISYWKGTWCLDKLQDTGGRENHGCADLRASRKLPAYVFEALKETVQNKKQWLMLVKEKTRNRERTNVKWTQDKAMANHS